MCPRPRSSIPGRTSRVRSIGPSRFTWTAPSMNSHPCFSKADVRSMAALFTSTSTAPNSRCALSTSASSDPRFLTSVGTATALPPCARISSATASSAADERAARTNLMPSCDRAHATCGPMPPVAPVNTAVRPARLSTPPPLSEPVQRGNSCAAERPRARHIRLDSAEFLIVMRVGSFRDRAKVKVWSIFDLATDLIIRRAAHPGSPPPLRST